MADAVDEFVEAAQAGRAVNRSGRSYRPSALRDVRGILEYHVVADLGELRLTDVRRSHVQALVDRLGVEHLSQSRIRSVVSALRALYAYAIDQGYAEFNPADGLVMPRVDQPSPASRSDEPWDEPPAWEERPPRRAVRDEPRLADEREREREPSPAQRRKRPAYEPLAPFPERLISYAIRAVFVLLAIVALVYLLESL
jgi:Phage integrase, N-terminal SAM-like domain